MWIVEEFICPKCGQRLSVEISRLIEIKIILTPI
jgi:predicted RNA-binding Zn-ribbon protein involved in translation (DUF1610 family)